MLTPVDVHYLVGLLSRCIEGATVDVTLGDMVYDTAKQGNRDVDITVRDKSGKIIIYKGIEVKAYVQSKKPRPISSEQIDGLIRKLQDMPEITNKSIVSATGFSKGAVNKAKYHNVDLYDFRIFEGVLDGDHMKMSLDPESAQFINNVYQWIGSVNTIINPKQNLSEAFIKKILISKKLTDKDGCAFEKFPNLNSFLNDVKIKVLNKIIFNNEIAKPAIGTPFNVDCTAEIQERPLIHIEGEEPLIINEIRLIGVVKSEQRKCAPQFRALFKNGNEQPEIGNLHGISLPTHGNIISALHVPIQDRSKNKIYQQKI